MTTTTSSSACSEDLQIEISANVDLFAVMVTRSNKKVESVVCVPRRGRAHVREACPQRPDPERFKSPLKDGRRSAMGDRRPASGGSSGASGVRYILDHDEGSPVAAKPSTRVRPRQRFHLRIAYPNGFTHHKRRSPAREKGRTVEKISSPVR
jgi:hypothetical protein